MRESLLKGTTFKTTSDSRRALALKEAETARTNAFQDLVIVIDDMAEDISEAHTKPIDGLNAETAFLRQFGEMITTNGDRLTQHFANGYAQADNALGELETVRGELGSVQRQLAESQQTNEALRRSAYEASDIQSHLAVAQRELIDAQEEINRLRREADKPNPLQNEVDQLRAVNARLLGSLQTEKAEHKKTKAMLAEYEQAPVRQPEPPTDTAPSGGPDAPEPANAPDNGILNDNGGLAAGEEPHTMTAEQAAQTRRDYRRRGGVRGVIGRLPGHNSNNPKDGDR